MNDLLKDITERTFKEQAIWFLNVSFCGEDKECCEKVWQYHKKCVVLHKRRENGNNLNEFDAHRILEYSQKAKTVRELRYWLTKFIPEVHGHCIESDLKVSLVELLLFIFEVDLNSIAKTALSGNGCEIEEASAGVEVLKTTLDYAISESEKAKERAETAKKAGDDAAAEEKRFLEAVSSANEAKKLLDEAERKAEYYLQRIKEEEDQVNVAKAALKDTMSNVSLGNVKRNKAKAELYILEAGDKTPLRKAKLDNEAALTKLRKAKTKAEETASNAQTMATAAERAKILAHSKMDEALKYRAKSEESIPIAMQALNNAYSILEKLQKECKIENGTIFYVNREIKEAEKFLPKSKIAALRASREQQKVDQKMKTSSKPSKTVQELKNMKVEILNELSFMNNYEATEIEPEEVQ